MGGSRIIITTATGRHRLAQAGLCLAALAVGMAAVAQDLPDPPRLTLDVDSGLEYSNNPGFVANPTESGLWARTDLRFGFSDETPLSRVSLTADVALRAGISGDTKDGIDLPHRRLAFSYTRDLVGGALDFNAALDDSRIDYQRPLSDFIDTDGNIVLPDDLDALTGSGWRQSLSYGTRLTLGEGGTLTTRLALGGSDLSYRDASDPTLDNSHRRYADLGFDIVVTPATTAEIGLRYSTYRDSDQDDETLAIRAGLSFARPDGSYGFRIEHEDAPDGTRLRASVNRRIERPWGSLDGRLGATRDENGDVLASGSLRLIYDLPSAQLTASLGRDVQSGSDDASELRTSLMLGYTRQLAPRSNMSFNATYIDSSPTDGSAGTTIASLGLGYGYELTQDWSLNLGLTHRRYDEDGAPRREETAVTLGLSRSFAMGL
ncbi:hypothetical protein [Frigidibacter sp. ROC022]|uniref:hypothetical protein n=1 Tax=Frigidibacter sp. ROC022 TaxID=2971796 RepID=UPI00215AD53F|nr:hypothetical protein [Frigidibacter sp. ROC022]MCR8726772.1 hypothetical protein [Frigidibacter sp. ROC022]